MKKIIKQIIFSSLCLTIFSIPVHAMKRKNESDDTNPSAHKKQNRNEYEGSSTSLIPVLLNNNSHIFAQRNAESVKALLDYQSRQYIEHLLIYLQPQMSQETRATFDEFIKQPAALGIGFLKEKIAPANKMAYFMALQLLKCVQVTEKEFRASDEKKFNDALMNFLEFRNLQLTITELLTFFSPPSKPMSLSEDEIINLINLFENDINDYTQLQGKFKAAHQILYPFTKGIEKIEESHIDDILEIIKNDTNEKKLEVALCLFGNITRNPEDYKAKLDLEVASFARLFFKYQHSPIILQNISFCLRNQVIFCDPHKLESYGSLLEKLFPHPNETVVQWASRGYGTRLVRELEFNAPISLKEFYPLLINQHESVVTWALSYCGTFLADVKLKPIHAIDGLEIYNHVLFALRMQDEREIKSGKIIESALWVLGNIVLRQEIEGQEVEDLGLENGALFFATSRLPTNNLKRKVIPKEIVKYIDFENMKIFPENGEKIILFACRCISNLTSSGSVNRIPLNQEILERVISLIDSKNEKIVVWSICFLGTLSTNAMEYNAKIRSDIGSENILRKLVSCLDQYSENAKILESALWSIHKIAWCERHQNSLRALGCTTQLLTKFLSHPSSDKVREGACLCFGVLATAKDNLDIFIKEMMPSLENVLRNQNSQLRLVAVRSLNTKVTSATKDSKESRIAIGKHEDVIKLLVGILSTDEPLLLETVSWCLGNLSLDQNNSAYICPFVLDEMILLLNKENPIYSNKTPGDIAKVIEGVCFCLCNLLVESSRNNELMSKDYGNTALFFINLLDRDPTGEYKYSAKVIEMALWSLHKILCGTDANSLSVYKSIIQSNKGFEKIVSLLEYPDDKVVAGACWCFGKMMPWNQEQCDKLESGRLLLDLLERFPNLENEKLVILATRCIGTICVNESGDAQKRYIGSVGMPTLLNILRKNSNDPALIETCCWCIASLLTLSENIKLFNQQDGISILRSFYGKKYGDKTIEAVLFIYSNILQDSDLLLKISQDDVHFMVKMKDYANAKMLEISAKKNSASPNERQDFTTDKVQRNVQTMTIIGNTTTTTTLQQLSQTPSNAQPIDEVAQLAKIVERAEQCLKILFNAGIYKGDVK